MLYRAAYLAQESDGHVPKYVLVLPFAVLVGAPLMPPQGAECQALISEAWEHHALKAVGRKGLTGTPRTKQRRRSCSFKVHFTYMSLCRVLVVPGG